MSYYLRCSALLCYSLKPGQAIMVDVNASCTIQLLYMYQSSVRFTSHHFKKHLLIKKNPKD